MRPGKDLSSDELLFAMRVLADQRFGIAAFRRYGHEGRRGVAAIARDSDRHFPAASLDRGRADPWDYLGIPFKDAAVADGDRDLSNGRRRNSKDSVRSDVRIQREETAAR